MATQSLGTEVTVDSVYYADNGEKIESWGSDGRLLVRDVVVHVSGPAVLQRLDKLQAEMDEMKVLRAAEMNEMKILHAAAAEINEMKILIAKSNAWLVRSVAAQIVLAADGEEFKATKCTRFKARGVLDKGVMDTAEALGLTPTQFINQADMVVRLVTRRNKQVHFSDLDELDEEVAEVASIITPALKDIAKWDCAVVLNYATIKKAFPDGFEKQE